MKKLPCLIGAAVVAAWVVSTAPAFAGGAQDSPQSLETAFLNAAIQIAQEVKARGRDQMAINASVEAVLTPIVEAAYTRGDSRKMIAAALRSAMGDAGQTGHKELVEGLTRTLRDLDTIMAMPASFGGSGGHGGGASPPVPPAPAAAGAGYRG